jgi:hypothetical protein
MILCFRIQGKPRASTIPVIEIWDIYIFIITFGSCCCHTLVISYQSNPVDSPEIGWKCARLRGQILCICWCIYQTEPSNIVHSFEPSKFSLQSYSTGAACAAPALASIFSYLDSVVCPCTSEYLEWINSTFSHQKALLTEGALRLCLF